MANIDAQILFADNDRNADFTDFPEKLRAWDLTSTNPDTISPYNPMAHSRIRYSELNALILRGLLEYTRGKDSSIGIVKVGVNSYASQCRLPDGSAVLCQADSNGRVFCCKRTEGGVHESIHPIKGVPEGVEAILLCILLSWAASGKDTVSKEMADAFADLKDTDGLPEEVSARYLCDAGFYGLKSGFIPCLLPGGSFELLTADRIARKEFLGTVICGSVDLIAPEEEEAKETVFTVGEAKALYARRKREKDWTEEERKLIPDFPEDFPVPAEVRKMAERYCKSTNSPWPIRNWAMRGPTGVGKSMNVKLLACILELPLVWHTCSAGTELNSFLCSFVPSTGEQAEGMKRYPGLEEIMGHPEAAYYKLTGCREEDISCDEVFRTYTALCAKHSEDRFILAESDYIRALKRGYLVEVQEFSRIRDPGVLVGLNQYDRPGSIIPLVDGTHVKRHPDAAVIWTDNTGYCSCRPVDPSFLRRLDYVIDMPELTAEQVLERTMRNTECRDLLFMEKMYCVFREIRETCQREEITGGSLSVTDFERWVQLVFLEGKDSLEQSLRECILSKAAAEEEDREELMESCAAVALAREFH